MQETTRFERVCNETGKKRQRSSMGTGRFRFAFKWTFVKLTRELERPLERPFLFLDLPGNTFSLTRSNAFFFFFLNRRHLFHFFSFSFSIFSFQRLKCDNFKRYLSLLQSLFTTRLTPNTKRQREKSQKIAETQLTRIKTKHL